MMEKNPKIKVETGKRILGLDYGRKRVGVAVSDALLMLAHGRETLHYRKRRELFEGLRDLIHAEDIGLIIVGLPRYLNGEDSEMTAEVKNFVMELQQHSHVPATTWDERFSSRQAERLLGATDRRKRREKGAIDQVAAVLILQSYLDSRAFPRTSA